MVRQLRQLKITTKCFSKVLSPYNSLSPKAIPLASRSDRYHHPPSSSIGWIWAYRPSDLYIMSPSIVRRTAPTGWPPTATASILKRVATSDLSPFATISHGELTSFCSWFDMYKCCVAWLRLSGINIHSKAVWIGWNVIVYYWKLNWAETSGFGWY